MQTRGRLRARLHSCRGAWLALVVLLLLCIAANPSLKPNVISWQPAGLVNGSPVLFRVPAANRVEKVTGTFLGHRLDFFRDSQSWYALAGVPLETSPGIYELKLTETSSAAKSVEIVRKIKIARAAYPKVTVKVARQFTEPNADQLRTITTDKAIKQKTFATETPERLWSGSFAAPVAANISDVFGTTRVFNNEVLSRHLGLDYGAPAGTPVHAVNRGQVILARDLYFEGGFVVIDHGQGLFSLYLHLSDFRVKEGDRVETGQVIALSGASGRATGPHLHVAIRWQGINLNPATLLQIKMP